MTKHKNSNFLVRVIKSVGAAFFGVQKEDHAEEDFAENHFAYYAIVAVALTLIFIFTVVLVVQTVLTG